MTRLKEKINTARRINERIVAAFNRLELRPRRNPLDVYLVALARRAVRLHRAVLILLESDFVAEAKVLTRALCELWIPVRWISNKDSEERATRFAGFEAKFLVTIPEILHKHIPSLIVRRRQDHDTLAQTAEDYRTHRKWADVSLLQMAEEPDCYDLLESGEGADATWHYDIPYTLHSCYVHSNAWGLRELGPQWGEPVDIEGRNRSYDLHEEEPLILSTGYVGMVFGRLKRIWSLPVEEEMKKAYEDWKGMASDWAQQRGEKLERP